MKHLRKILHMNSSVVLCLLILVLYSITIHDVYGCSRDGRLDYFLPWKTFFPNPDNCETQLTVSWPGLVVWIVMGFLLYNLVMVLVGKKTVWQKE